MPDAGRMFEVHPPTVVVSDRTGHGLETKEEFDGVAEQGDSDDNKAELQGSYSLRHSIHGSLVDAPADVECDAHAKIQSSIIAFGAIIKSILYCNIHMQSHIVR